MIDNRSIQRVGDIEFAVIFSRRRTLGISVLNDSSVVVRVPYRTSFRTITRMVEEKSSWIIRHRDYFRNQQQTRPVKSYTNGSIHSFRGNSLILNIQESRKPFVRFEGSTIEMGLEKTGDEISVSRLLKKAYKNEAQSLLPSMFINVLERYKEQKFSPTGLVIRSMKRRWGSCSNKGKITLSSELVKLNETHIEYVIIHELCHLRHHNHGSKYYELLGELFPEWKKVRKEMRGYVR